MIQCTCMVQQDQTAARRQAALTNMLEGFAERSFGEPLTATWVLIPPGSAFTAAAPSTSSIVSMTAPGPVSQETRAGLLNTLCDLWMEQTGCSLDEIVAVLNDPQPA